MLMKCGSCGGFYNRILAVCPYCGAQSKYGVTYSNKTVAFLARPRRFGNINLTTLNVLLIIAINVSLTAFVINLFTFNSTGFWFQYIAGVLAASYSVLRGLFGTRETALRTVRRALLSIYIMFYISAVGYRMIACDTAAMAMEEYVLPSIIIVLAVVSFVFLLRRLATRISFYFTCALNTMLSTSLLVNSIVNDGFNFAIVIYVAFGLSVLILVNYLLYHIMSLISFFKRGY